MRKELARPAYIVTNDRGAITEIYCKSCGTQIAHMENLRLKLHDNYVEMKLRFDDNSFHVTNICAGCMDAVASDPANLQALHDADIDQMSAELNSDALEFYKARQNPRCVAADLKQRGLI